MGLLEDDDRCVTYMYDVVHVRPLYMTFDMII